MKNASFANLILAATILIVLNSNFTFAQAGNTVSAADPKATIGINTNVNFSMLTTGGQSANKAFGSNAGFGFGFTGTARISKAFSFVYELNNEHLNTCTKGQMGDISMVPGVNTQVPANANFSMSAGFNYIQVPVMFRVTTGRKLKIYAEAGHYISMLTSSSAQTNTIAAPAVANTRKQSSSSVDITAAGNGDNASGNNTMVNNTGATNFNTLNIGLTFGAGISYTMKKSSIWMDARCEKGLSNICTAGDANYNFGINTYKVGIGYSVAIR